MVSNILNWHPYPEGWDLGVLILAALINIVKLFHIIMQCVLIYGEKKNCNLQKPAAHGVQCLLNSTRDHGVQVFYSEVKICTVARKQFRLSFCNH